MGQGLPQKAMLCDPIFGSIYKKCEMRQKLNNYHKEIRRNQLHQIFQAKRIAILQGSPQSITKETPPESTSAIQDEDSNCTEADIYQQWKLQEQQLNQHISDSNYEAAAPIISSALTVLKRVSNEGNMLNERCSQIYHVFLRTTILSNIVKCVVAAERERCTPVTLQRLTRPAVGVLKYMTTFEPTEFREALFLGSDILPFLRICNSELSLDKNHLSRIITITTHMIIVSTAETGQLLAVLNDMNSTFNVSAPFYAISKLSPQPKEDITINFIIMLKNYLLEVESQKIPLNLTHHHIDLCFQTAIRSVNFYLTNDSFSDREAGFSLEESLEVLRILVERSDIDNKWLKQIDYKGLTNLLRERGCPSQISKKIFIIIDHLIFSDTRDELTFELVKHCELLPTIWTRRQEQFGFVLNILNNLASLAQYKMDLEPFIHLIFLNVRLSNQMSLMNRFIYNWFSTQGFEIRDSRDKLMIHHLTKSEETDTEIVKEEAAIWIKLVEANNLIVPKKVFEHDNPNSHYLKSILMGSNPDYV